MSKSLFVFLIFEAKRDGWTVISMKNDWKRIFEFEQKQGSAEITAIDIALEQ